MWIRKNLLNSQCLIIALTSLNYNNDKKEIFNFESLLKSNDFSTILLKDLDNSWYTKRIKGVGCDYQETIAFLKEICKKYKKIMVIGSSMAGFGAILYGAYLNADKIIAFAPQTNITENFNKIIGDNRFIDFFNKLKEVPESIKDLKSFLKFNTVKSIDLFVSSNEKNDLFHAKNLQDIANVNINTIDFFDHYLVDDLREYGFIREIISQFLTNNKMSNLNKYIFNFKEKIENFLLNEDFFLIENRIKYLLEINNSFDIDGSINFNKLRVKFTFYRLDEFNNKMKHFFYAIKNVSDLKCSSGLNFYMLPIEFRKDQKNILMREFFWGEKNLKNIGIKSLIKLV